MLASSFRCHFWKYVEFAKLICSKECAVTAVLSVSQLETRLVWCISVPEGCANWLLEWRNGKGIGCYLFGGRKDLRTWELSVGKEGIEKKIGTTVRQFRRDYCTNAFLHSHYQPASIQLAQAHHFEGFYASKQASVMRTLTCSVIGGQLSAEIPGL